ncbi:MAG: peptidyl-prolyl cis-trans isomerase [Anaeromyxobacter sp.]
MRIGLSIVVAALGLAACGRCGASRPAAPAAPPPVAVVNGEPILPDALARELSETRAGEAQGPLEPVKRRILDDLVARALLLQEARARSIVVGQDLVEREFLRVRAEYPGTHFDDLLAEKRLSQADLKARLKDQLTMERLLEQEVFQGVQVSDQEIERWYGEHASEFEVADQVRVSQIVVASRDEAVQIRDRLRKNPQTFAEVAKKSSIAPEARNGGDLGFIAKGGGFPEVFDVTFQMAPNVISDVTPSPYGFHLFKVTERRPAGRRTLEQAKPEIKEKLLRQKRLAAQEEYLAALKKRAKVEIDEKALGSVTP